MNNTRFLSMSMASALFLCLFNLIKLFYLTDIRGLGFQQKKRTNYPFILCFLLDVKVNIEAIHGKMGHRSAEDNEVWLTEGSGLKMSSINKTTPCFFRANERECAMKEYLLFMYPLVNYPGIISCRFWVGPDILHF